MFRRDIIEKYLPENPQKDVAHYTRLGSLCYLFKQGWNCAWATPVQFLNDRQELALGLSVLRKSIPLNVKGKIKLLTALDNLSQFYGDLQTDAFQLSFSGNPDELGQWRGYGHNGNGCSIVTSVPDVHNAAQVAGWVIYDPHQQEVFAKNVLERIASYAVNEIDLQRILVACASFIKHEGFKSGQEYRLLRFAKTTDVFFREVGSRIVPSLDCLGAVKKHLSVEKIIIGPGWELGARPNSEQRAHYVVQGLRRLLDSVDLKETEIGVSRIPYDPR